MLIEKEIISPGTYWYTDQQTGLPRKLDVTPELMKYWHEQGSAMLSAGLTVPVPFEHDFNAHPMTPKDKLLNNAGEVKEYRLRDDRLYGVVDVQDPDAKRKIGHSIRWTSPWINSFTDGQGKQWNNVISHLALTTRPRITKQAPFTSIAAAMSLSTEVKVSATSPIIPKEGICLSKAGRLVRRKKDKQVCPLYPIAFSLYSGATLAEDEGFPPKKDKKDKKKDKKSSSNSGGGNKPPPIDSDDDSDDDSDNGLEDMDGGDLGKETTTPSSGDGGSPVQPPTDSASQPFQDAVSDVSMEELLCDLLGALGIYCEKSGGPETFKRSLYNAAMTKIHELTAKGQGAGEETRANPPGQPPNNPPPSQTGQPGQPVQQEQQPMFMSIEEINKLPDPMRTVALSMYNENVRLRSEVDANAKTANSLRDSKLKEENSKRSGRIAVLSKLSPRLKADLEAMVTQPSMALSMGDSGAVVDPMEQTLIMLEKSLSDIPRLLTTNSASLSAQPHPTDGEMSSEESDALADSMARMMGCPPEQKKAS